MRDALVVYMLCGSVSAYHIIMGIGYVYSSSKGKFKRRYQKTSSLSLSPSQSTSVSFSKTKSARRCIRGGVCHKKDYKKIERTLKAMANYNRSIKTDLWMTIAFRDLTSDEKVVYLFLHTADLSSDSSVFFCPISDVASCCNLSKAKVLKILKKFEEAGYIVYDYDYQEVFVKDYFWLHPPVGGLGFEMFYKDLSKIKSHHLIDLVVENSKEYEISLPFFTALQDVRPNIKQDDYAIKPTKMTCDELRTAANRGRSKSRAKSGAKQEEPTKEKTYTNENTEIIDEDLPFRQLRRISFCHTIVRRKIFKKLEYAASGLSFGASPLSYPETAKAPHFSQGAFRVIRLNSKADAIGCKMTETTSCSPSANGYISIFWNITV